VGEFLHRDAINLGSAMCNRRVKDRSAVRAFL
jgi:hypothetical protein